jgi:uncharacterized membrane protein
VLIAVAFTRLYKSNYRIAFVFLVISSFFPFLFLAITDLISLTNRSTVTRYLVGCFPTIYIAVAYFFSDRFSRTSKLWRGIFALVIIGALLSNDKNARSESSWAIPPSSWNGEIARKINTVPAATLISDRGDNWTNLGDILSINYRIDPDVRYYLTSYPPDIEKLERALQNASGDVFLFRPSTPLLKAFQQLQIPVENIYPAGELWKVTRRSQSP